jgi:hypothetical protein
MEEPRLAEEALGDIHKTLQRTALETARGQASGKDEEVLLRHEPFHGRLARVPFEQWARSPAVWRERYEAYRKGDNAIMSAFLADKTAKSLQTLLGRSLSLRALRRQQISDMYILKAECWVRTQSRPSAPSTSVPLRDGIACTGPDAAL